MKNKRNQNNIAGGPNAIGALNSLGALNAGQGRDSSNDPYENNTHNGNGGNGQRVDTGGGEYLQNEDMDIMSSGNNYQLPLSQQQYMGNKNFSPKGTQGPKHIG